MTTHCRECGHKIPEGSGPYFCDPCYDWIITQVLLDAERREGARPRTQSNERSET